MADKQIVLPSFAIMDDCTQRVQELTGPLKALNINLFSHTRVYKDNTFIDISDRGDMLDYFYYQTDLYEHYIPDVNPWAFKDEFFLCSTLKGNPSIEGLRDDLRIDNIIVLFEIYKDHCELWHFGTMPDNELMTSFYLNNIHLLKEFCYYFKEQASDVIHLAEQNKIKRSKDLIENCECPPCVVEGHIQAFQDSFELGGIEFCYKRRAIKLSKREREVIKWSLLGKTSTEVAMILGISKRTVEAHLAKVKRRFDCYKLIDVMRVLEHCKLVDTILR